MTVPDLENIPVRPLPSKSAARSKRSLAVRKVGQPPTWWAAMKVWPMKSFYSGSMMPQWFVEKNLGIVKVCIFQCCSVKLQFKKLSVSAPFDVGEMLPFSSRSRPASWGVCTVNLVPHKINTRKDPIWEGRLDENHQVVLLQYTKTRHADDSSTSESKMSCVGIIRYK